MKFKNLQLCIALPLVCLSISCAACGPDGDKNGKKDSQLFINEIMSSNSTVVADELGEYDDWIEIFNASTDSLNLEGYFISDDPDDVYKRRLSNELTVAGQAFLLLWADGQPDQGPQHLPFKLKKNGEAVLLTSPKGNLLDDIAFSAMGTDQSLARFPDGTGDFVGCGYSSPGESNGTECPVGTGRDASTSSD